MMVSTRIRWGKLLTHLKAWVVVTFQLKNRDVAGKNWVVPRLSLAKFPGIPSNSQSWQWEMGLPECGVPEATNHQVPHYLVAIEGAKFGLDPPCSNAHSLGFAYFF